jgi:hypothetical protein
MKIDNDYFDSPAYRFNQENPEFWKCLRKYKYDAADFAYICNVITNNMINLSIGAFETISYCFKFSCSNGTDEERDRVDNFYRITHELANSAYISANTMESELLCKIGESFKCVRDDQTVIKCIYNSVAIDITDINFMHSLVDLNNSLRRQHFYVMLYVFDLTMRIQKIKSEIIKYELARNGKQSGTVLDICVDENYVYYIELNKEFRKYNKIMASMNYYGTRIGEVEGLGNIFCPSNNHLLYFYYDIKFDFTKNKNVNLC